MLFKWPNVLNATRVMKRLELDGPPVLNYAYGLLMVFDSCEKSPQSRWTQQHEQQGFARRESSVHFATLNQEGRASVEVFDGEPDSPHKGGRIIYVPMKLPSGQMNIQGPEEWQIERFVRVAPGEYTVTLSQLIDQETRELILDFFLSLSSTPESRILRADEMLKPPDVPLETADPVELVPPNKRGQVSRASVLTIYTFTRAAFSAGRRPKSKFHQWIAPRCTPAGIPETTAAKTDTPFTHVRTP